MTTIITVNTKTNNWLTVESTDRICFPCHSMTISDVIECASNVAKLSNQTLASNFEVLVKRYFESGCLSNSVVRTTEQGIISIFNNFSRSDKPYIIHNPLLFLK